VQGGPGAYGGGGGGRGSRNAPYPNPASHMSHKRSQQQSQSQSSQQSSHPQVGGGGGYPGPPCGPGPMGNMVGPGGHGMNGQMNPGYNNGQGTCSPVSLTPKSYMNINESIADYKLISVLCFYTVCESIRVIRRSPYSFVPFRTWWWSLRWRNGRSKYTNGIWWTW